MGFDKTNVMNKIRNSLPCCSLHCSRAAAALDRRSKANAWYAKSHGLLAAISCLPTLSTNSKCGKPATFDPKRIDLELGWAQSLGMTTMRVFLHDLLWQQDSAGFKKRIDTFLTIADKHHIKPLFVLFDSCWDPNPKLGQQHAPTPGVHNSGWVQSPGAARSKTNRNIHA